VKRGSVGSPESTPNGALSLPATIAGGSFSTGSERYWFYPPCPVWVITHLQCPGCGATRAMAALLHGRVLEALQYNSKIVFLAPFFLGYLDVIYFRAVRDDRWMWPDVPVAAVRYLLGFAAVFAVARNISWL